MSELEYAQFCTQAARRRQRFDAYRDEIIELIELNMADGRHLYVSSVYDVLEERHGVLPGTQRTLGNYIRMLHDTGAIERTPTDRVRRPEPAVEPGRQCQVDFGQQRINAAETAYIFVAVLAHSRARYVAVQDHPFHTLEVLQHLLRCFAYFGGRPRELVIDQDKLMTVSENDGEVIHTTDFRHFLTEQQLEVWLCRKQDPQSKGKVENAVKFVKTSFFSARQFTAVQEIHAPLAQWLTRRANGRICQATGRVPAVVLEQQERPALRALRASIYDTANTAGRDTRKADEMAMISFAGNRYSVPAEYAGTTVGVVATATNLMVRDLATGELIARHRIPSAKSQTIVAPHHRVPKGVGADEVYRELAEQVADESWHHYLARNREHYRRYWKDQAAGLKRLVTASADNREALTRAVQFCLETESFGVGDLTSAFAHLDHAGRNALEPLLEHAKPLVIARRDSRFGVPKRTVGYYSSLVSLVAGGAA
jgi:hypothetical protein